MALTLGASGQTYGNYPVDPRVALLQAQAYRQEPIEGPTQLLGRLGLAAASQYHQRSFEEQVAQARSQFAQGIQSPDINARYAAVSAGLSSRDPAIVAASGALLPTLQQEDKLVSTPGGGTTVVPTMGGRVVGAPQQLVQGRATAPNLLTFKDGENERTLMFDPNSGQLVDIATAPRETLQRILPPEVFQQQIELKQASGKAQGEALGQVVTETQAKAGAQAAGGFTGKLEAVIAFQQPIFLAAEQELIEATKALIANPTSYEAAQDYEAARASYGNALAKMRDPMEAVTADATVAATKSLPDAAKVALAGKLESNPVMRVLDTNYTGLAGKVPKRERLSMRPGGKQGAAPQMTIDPSKLSPAERQRLIELLQKP
jgi:hypothetical protein